MEIKGSYYLHLPASASQSYLVQVAGAGPAEVTVGLRLVSDLDPLIPAASVQNDHEAVEHDLEVSRVEALDLEPAEYTALVGDGRGEAREVGERQARTRTPVFEGHVPIFAEGDQEQRQSNNKLAPRGGTPPLWDRRLRVEVVATLRKERLRYAADVAAAEYPALIHCPRGERMLEVDIEPSGDYLSRKAKKRAAEGLPPLAPRLRITLRETQGREGRAETVEDPPSHPDHVLIAGQDGDAGEAWRPVSLCRIEDTTRSKVTFGERPPTRAVDIPRILRAHRRRQPCVVDDNDDDEGGTTTYLPIDDLAVKIGDAVVGPVGGTRFAIGIRVARRRPTARDLRFAGRVAEVVENAARYLRQRELRDSARLHARDRIDALAQDKEAADEATVMRGALGVLDDCLPGCRVYVLLLAPGASKLRCAAANAPFLTHLGRAVARDDDDDDDDDKGGGDPSPHQLTRRRRPVAPLFDCADGATATRVLRSHEETTSSVRGGNEEASICFLPPWPLRYPAVLAPLSYEGHGVGVLVADSFDHVARVHDDAPDEPPEPGVVDLLSSTAIAVGRAVDGRRKARALADVGAAAGTATHAAARALALRAAAALIPHARAAEIWAFDSADRRFRGTARSWTTAGDEDHPSSTLTRTDDDDDDDDGRRGGSVVDDFFDVIVAESPDAVAKRAAAEGIQVPERLARARRMHDLATTRPHLPPGGNKDAASPQTAGSVVVVAAAPARTTVEAAAVLLTELALGHLAHAVMNARWDRPQPTVVSERAHKRLAIPLLAEPEPTLLVVTATRLDKVDVAFAKDLAATLRATLLTPEPEQRPTAETAAPAPAPLNPDDKEDPHDY